MRAELSTIQQMLTPEAASVLARSIVEAVQRKHGRITPLHVAAVLLAAPSGILRRSCLSSHPDSAAHPLRCRALELCFSVALDRLPSDGSRDAAQPPMSNALKAALKRAQANQRRGCPEQPQQPAAPLLAVKVELEQLVVSILDDPQVSRVMREAGFSSTVVKAVVEQSLSSSSSNSSSTSSTITAAVLSTTSPVSPVPPSPAHLYVNPRLFNGRGEQPRTEEVKRVMSTLSRSKKRNPVLISDVDPEAVIQEVIQKIKSGAAPPPIHTTKVVSFGNDLSAATASGVKSWIAAKIRELGSILESQLIGGDHGVVVEIGDLKWLVDSARPPTITSPNINAQQTVSETARTAVAEMATLLKSFRDGGHHVWLLGTATWTTYLRCQVYHPTMEDDWDLQAVQIAPSSQNFPRTSKQFPETINSATHSGMCALCTDGYKHDITKGSHQPPPKVDENRSLPPWLQLAKLHSESTTTDHLQHKETLLKKWQDICSRLHSKASPPSPLLLCSGNSPAISLPEISVKTDLVLGNSATFNLNEPKKVEFLNQKNTNFTGVSDIDTFKRLYKGLLNKVSWQPKVAASMAATVLRLKSESRRRGHSWLLYLGPDKIGKRKMATALSELVFGTPPVIVKLGGDGEEEGECTVSSSRGRTSMDRIVEAIRSNPFAVVLIEEFDQTDDVLVRGSIKRAMEQVLNLPLQCTLDFTSQCQSFGLFRSLYVADHGELVCGWTDVHMEIFFVDDIPGLRFILFEGCLKRSISLFCLIIKILNQHVEKCNFTDTEIPCSSIVVCISRLDNSREELLFLNLFSKVESSRWRRFEGKLKKLCTKEASISTPYIPANTLYFSTNEISHSSIKQFEKFWERTNLLHRPDMKKAVDPVLNNFVHCMPEEREKLFSCSLYLANGSSFYPSLYQKLLIEKDTTSGAQTSVSSQKDADNTNTSTIDASSSFDDPPKQASERVGRSGPCFSEAAADHISSSIHTWSSGTYGDRYADTSRTNGHQVVVAGIAGSDDVGHITSRGCVLQSGRSPNEAATSVHAQHFGSEYAEDSFPLKSHDDRHMISPTNVEAPLLEEVEKHNLQKGLLIHHHCSNLILEMKEHGIHSPTVPRSMWHRNRHSSLSRTFIHNPKLGSMDIMANGVSSGYKRPRTQVSYSVLAGGYEHASKSLNNHQKVHSHKKVKKLVVNTSSEYSRSSQNFSDSLLCEANVLITHGDKCWREVGAKIQLDCDDQKNWRIRVQVSGVTKYVYKAYHVLQPGTTNRYTHAMMWKGGNEWTLEFTHRNQWYIFKQIYEACYNQNIRAASVKNIPIPGVRLLSDSNDGFIEVPFARNSLKYFRYIGTEVDFALDPSHVLYDMDSEDEEWISSARVSMDSSDSKIPEVTEDMFEKVMDRFEKLTYTQQCEELTNEDIEKYMADVGQTDSVEVIYDHWRQKRKKKGLPLIRQFQPPLWEQYQQQLKEWELNQSRMPIQSGGCYNKADIMRKPPMFAFCLRPRGLEVPYKDSKQRSHKKLMFNGHHNVLMREQDSFHNLGRKMDGFSLGEATGSSYESSDSYHGLQSRTTFSPKDTASTESLSAHDSSERFLDARYSRSNSKRIEAFLSPRYPQRTPFTYNQKSRNGVNKWSSEFCESSGIKQAPFNGIQRHHADMDEFRLRDATSAAQHALNMAKLKREKAQWLLHKADLSLHRATVALMTAEAIKSYEEDIVGDG